MNIKIYSRDENEDHELRSLPVMPIFCAVPGEGAEGDVWHLANAVVHRDRPGDLSTIASSDDLYSETGSHTDTIRSQRSSFSSTGSLDSVAQSSQATTPQESPVSTPVPRRKVRTSLKLNIADSTWRRSRERRSSKRSRIKQNLQSKSARVMAAVQKQKLPEFRLKMILLSLLCAIIILVAYSLYWYERERRQLVIKGKIEFHQMDRTLKLLDDDQSVILESKLGIKIPGNLHPYNCGESKTHYFTNYICVQWMYRARLQIKHESNENISCYNFHWESLNLETMLKDCINMKGSDWYGIGSGRKLTWPLNGVSGKSKAFVTGKISNGEFGSVLERYWLSSGGIAVRVEPEVPLYVNINNSGNGNLCLAAKYDGFPYYNKEGILPELRYTICRASSIRTVHEEMVKRFITLPESIKSYEVMEKPVWLLSSILGMKLNSENITNYASKILEGGFKGGLALLDRMWQAKDGEMNFKTEDFLDLSSFLNLMNMKKFKLLVTVHPYMCLESPSFIPLSDLDLFVLDPQNQAPLLIRWHNKLCAVIDFTRNESADWYLLRLNELKKYPNIGGFFFAGGKSSYLPRNYKFNQTYVNPDHYIRSYLNVAKQSSSLIGAYVGFETQNIAAYISLLPRTPTWDSHTGLRSIIPNVLILGLMGYPVINIGSIGGDVLSNATLPDRDLYLRWMQLSMFMPVVQFSIYPDHYDRRLEQIAKDLLHIRELYVLPVMKAALQEYKHTGAPIVRPLWWLFPNDRHARHIDSEFLIGEDIIVAPILEPRKHTRDIYLPAGMWWDNEVKEERGGKWIHNYEAKTNQIPYFRRQKRT